MAVHPFGMWHVGETFYQAVDLEDEEDDQYEEGSEERSTKFIVKCFGTDQLCGDILVIAIGTPANMFVDTFLDLPSQPVGEVINSNDENSSKTNKETCMLYQIGKIILCQCHSSVPSQEAHGWVQSLLSHVQPNTVVVLCSQTKTSFHGDVDAKNSDSDVLRYLKTSTMSGEGITPPLLEHGTVVSDLPAAVISYCEMFRLPCLMYVSFTESHFVDVFTLKTLEVVLTDSLLATLPRLPKSVLTARLKDFEGVGVADNNLYI